MTVSKPPGEQDFAGNWETITDAVPDVREAFLTPPAHQAKHRKPVSWQVTALAARFRSVTRRGGRRGA